MQTSEEMAEGVVLRPDQLPSCQGEPGRLGVKSEEQEKSKILKKVDDLHLKEAAAGGEADSTDGSTGDSAGKWNAANLFVALFKLLYIPLGLVTLLLLATNFYLNFPFPLAIALASIVGLQQSGCLNSYFSFN